MDAETALPSREHGIRVAMRACAAILTSLLGVGGAPSALAALVLAAVCQDEGKGWVSCFVAYGCITGLRTLMAQQHDEQVGTALAENGQLRGCFSKAQLFTLPDKTKGCARPRA